MTLPKFEVFGSSHTHLAVFPAALIAVSKVAHSEAFFDNAAGLATHAISAALGPLGLLAEATAKLSELNETAPEMPPLELWEVEAIVQPAEVTTLVQGQVPKALRQTGKWPLVEWFRPIAVFPKHMLRGIHVSWTSSVTWYVVRSPQRWRTEINFWGVPRLRRTLEAWHYPVA